MSDPLLILSLNQDEEKLNLFTDEVKSLGFAVASLVQSFYFMNSARINELEDIPVMNELLVRMRAAYISKTVLTLSRSEVQLLVHNTSLMLQAGATYE